MTRTYRCSYLPATSLQVLYCKQFLMTPPGTVLHASVHYTVCLQVLYCIQILMTPPGTVLHASRYCTVRLQVLYSIQFLLTPPGTVLQASRYCTARLSALYCAPPGTVLHTVSETPLGTLYYTPPGTVLHTFSFDASGYCTGRSQGRDFTMASASRKAGE